MTTQPDIEKAARECAEKCAEALTAWMPRHSAESALTPLILAAMRGVAGDEGERLDFEAWLMAYCGTNSLRTAKQAIQELAKQQSGWIPVSERLPERVDVLCFDGTKTFIAMWCPVSKQWAVVPHECRFVSHTVTHWQPLPPAPGAMPVRPEQDTLAQVVTLLREVREQAGEHIPCALKKRIDGALKCRSVEMPRTYGAAMAHIGDLTADNVRLRGALEPFAVWLDDYEFFGCETSVSTEWMKDQCRAAKAALAGTGTDPVAGDCANPQCKQAHDVLNILMRHLIIADSQGAATTTVGKVARIQTKLDADNREFMNFRAECERLRGERDAWKHGCDARDAVKSSLRGQIERLRTDVNNRVARITAIEADNQKLVTEVCELHHKLSEALRLMGPFAVLIDLPHRPDTDGTNYSICLGAIRAIVAFVAKHGQKGGQ